MMFNRVIPPKYLTFEDNEFWRILCCYYGDYNEVVVTDNGNNTVDITTSFVSKNYYTEKKRTVVSTQTNVDNSGGTYVAGTTKEAVGITQVQCDAILELTPVDTNYNTYGRIFMNNTAILSLNDLAKLRNLTSIKGNYGGKSTNSGFSGCTNIVSVNLPNSFLSIGDCSFYKCTSLSSINFNNTAIIGQYGFMQTSLTQIVLNEGFTSIGVYAFYKDTSLAYLDLPSTTTSIGGDALAGVSSRPVFVCRATTPPTLGRNNAGNVSVIYVPAAAVEDYKATTNWSAQASKIQAIEGTWYETHRSLEPTT